jgi:hypothetical protein
MIIYLFKSLFKRRSRLYLNLSLFISLYYGIYFYYIVFSQEYIVQDDARQHIVWLQKFIDSDLFPDDLIANYFYNLAPLGFKLLYISLAKLGLSPLLLAKLLPPILGIITTIYLYLFTLKILPIPLAGLFSSLLINQLMWLNDDLVSATHRAFIYPLFAAFLYYLAEKTIIPCLIVMLLQGLFYPHILLIEMAILSLRLLVYKGKSFIQLTKQKQLYIWWFLGLIITAIALIPITQKPPELDITVTAIQMQQMPEFNLGGRSFFFGGGWFKYWLAGSSGLSLPLFPTIVWLGIALPWLLKTQLPVIKLITNKIEILLQVTIASLVMFWLAHLLLPQLHLPSRYTYHTLRFILAISTAIVLTVLFDLGTGWLNNQTQLKLLDQIKIAGVTFLAVTIIIFPAIPVVFTNWFQNWQVGTVSEIYQYLGQQPKDILVASLSEEVNNIPAFSERSILVGREFAMAYHPTYYNQIKQRTVDLLEAQYSFKLQVIQSFIKKYSVDYWLLDYNAFTPEYLLGKDWLINSSWSETTKKAIAKLESNSTPKLKELVSSCSVISTETLNLLNSSCILNRS